MKGTMPFAVQGIERGQVCIGSRPAGVQERTERILFIDNKLRSDGPVNTHPVQIAANNALAGPNGIGGITVDGSRKEMKITTDKKGNVNCSFSVQGIGISAQVYITLTNGGNNASARISPNFNSNTLTLNGVLVPLSQSNVYKGRAL